MYILKYAGSVLHDPRIDVQISAGTLKEESGQSPTLSFTVQPTHPLWRAFNRESVMNTEREIELTEYETQKILFRGRIRKVSMSMNGSIDVTCEGAMAYLNDTTVRPYKTYDTDEIDCEINAPAKAGELFEWFIEQHNSRVSNRCEKFKVGINAGVNFGALQRGTGTRPTTLKEMREKLTKLCGGYFRVRYVGEDNYLDWLNADGSSEAAQSVELGQNLLDLNTGADGKDIYTAIVPVGKTGEGEDEKDVTIDDEHAYVGGGYDIVGDAVVDTAMAERYGVIEKLMEYDHLSQPQALADKAVADLAAGKLSDSITVSATDLHYADATVQQIDYLQRVQVTSEPHGIDRMMLCVGRTINLVDSKATRYSFGAIEGTLTKSGTTSRERTQEATDKRLTALASTTRKTVEDTHKTTVAVAAVEEKAVAVEKKADAATEKIADVATTATAAAEKVETVAAKAEKAAEEVSNVATDAKNATTAAKEAKTMATEASNKAAEVKATVDNLSNAFSHDARGAYVGDKTKQFVWVNKDGVWLMDGKTLNASFTSKRASLAGDKLIIDADQTVLSGLPDGEKKGTLLSSDNVGFRAKDTVMLTGNQMLAMIGSNNILINNRGLQISKNFISNNYTKIDDLVKLIKFTSWTTLQDDGVCRVRYCIRGGMMYLDCYLAAGYSARITTAEMPDNLLPAIEGYYPMGTETGGHTAKIWIGAAGGGNKRIYLYNNSTGYATGIIPILPKSLE
nr:MAG TPA: minor structural protein [Caudoviricetes sp.]